MPDIIRLTVVDAPQLAELHAASFTHGVWSGDQIRSSLNLASTHGWSARDGKNILGFILCQITGDEAEILTLCVHPEARRQGIAAQLIQTAIDALKNQNTQRLFLDVAADNGAARSLYEKSGFRQTGMRRDYYQRGGQKTDAALYEFKI